MADATFVQCNSCGGIYRPVQSDGTTYYHACPARKVIGSTPAPTKADPEATAPVFQPIANRRDENVDHVDKSGTVFIKSIGTGCTPVVEPAVIDAAGFSPREL